jgi:hypothetical protein
LDAPDLSFEPSQALDHVIGGVAGELHSANVPSLVGIPLRVGVANLKKCTYI